MSRSRYHLLENDDQCDLLQPVSKTTTAWVSNVSLRGFLSHVLLSVVVFFITVSVTVKVPEPMRACATNEFLVPRMFFPTCEFHSFNRCVVPSLTSIQVPRTQVTFVNNGVHTRNDSVGDAAWNDLVPGMSLNIEPHFVLTHSQSVPDT